MRIPALAGAEQSQEGLADLGCPRDRVRQPGRLDGIEQPGSRKPRTPARASATSASATSTSAGPSRDGAGLCGARGRARDRGPTIAMCSTLRACSNRVRINPSVAVSRGSIGEPHALRDLGLELHHEPVAPRALPGRRSTRVAPGLSRRQQVHRAPCPHQELLGGVDRLALRAPEETRVLQGRPHRGLQPAERGDVAQAAAPLLQIGLEQVRGRSVALAATRRPPRAARVAKPSGSPRTSSSTGRQRASEQERIAGDGRGRRASR